MSIPDIAKQFSFFERQLERRFADTFRISPSQYLIRLRVLIAAGVLQRYNIERI